MALLCLSVQERIVIYLSDALWIPTPGDKKPRTYRNQAHKNYLLLARNKRPGNCLIRQTIRKHLGYLQCNLKTIELLKKTKPLSKSQQEQLKVLKDVYEQQQDMYMNSIIAFPDEFVMVDIETTGCDACGRK